MGINGRGTKAKTITSCDNAFVTNIGAVAVAVASLHYAFAQNEPLSLPLRFRAKNICWPETLECSEAAANVLSVRKRSDSNNNNNNKAPSRNGNQPLALLNSHTVFSTTMPLTNSFVLAI
ncbi:hypothetical protein [Lysinibacillus xylanilyticus]|uniref:hypothetical protein n=1 Tax=Lysinibacillus xylanilyticus TaxID=582475 RepID=UPI003D059B6B